jgi:hypothetical protein
VGARASCEVGLPSGDELKEQIVRLLRRTGDNAFGFSDETMQQIMRTFVGADLSSLQNKLQPYKAAADRILRGLPLALSIDNFLHSHQDDPHVLMTVKCDLDSRLLIRCITSRPIEIASAGHL